jgi:hypothetical protein
MALDPVSLALEVGGKLIDRFFPDPAEKQAAQLRLLELAQSGELARLTAETELARGQQEVNKVEASSERLFVAGWRPFVGWICAAALGFKFIGGPLLLMVAAWFGVVVQLPDIGAGELLPLLLGMLGLGGLRTVEKVKGVA